ncbi:terpene cyclase/mutase family protein [bacterium]|nr:terpene cyclase/mutase family protein [bacterium]
MSDYFNRHQIELSDDIHVNAGAQWLFRAQKKAPDGGLSRGYYFSNGWRYSHVGCAGDAAETLFNMDNRHNVYYSTAIKVSDWLVRNQLSSGAFHKNYVYESEPRVINTALAIFGLNAAFKHTNDEKYLISAKKAGDWLVNVQEPDGSWRKFNFIYKSDIFTYHTKTAYSLFRIFQISGEEKYLQSCIKNIEWSLQYQLANGYFLNASMNGDRDPHTHLIAYVLRGLVEVGIVLNNLKYVHAVEAAVSGMMKIFYSLKFLPATLNSSWGNFNNYFNKFVQSSCLCGDAEIAIVALRLYEFSKREQYYFFARDLIRGLKRMHDTTHPNLDIRGGLKGSSKIYDVFYEQFAYPNWGVKFFIDALLLKKRIEMERLPIE